MNKKMKKFLDKGKATGQDIMKKFMKYDSRDRGFIVYLLVLVFFVIFTPIFSIEHITSDSSTNYYLFGTLSLFKSFLLIAICLAVLLAWNMSYRAKELLSTLFWFRENTFLLNFSMLWVITTAYISIWEIVTTIKSATPTVSVTNSYIIVQILLLLWLLYMLYLTITTTKKGPHIHIVNESYKGKESNDMEDVFTDMKS